MGNRLNSILKRLFDYPIKRKPICFYRQEDFSSTGEPLPKEEQEQKGPPTEYDKLVQAFYSKLLAQRQHNRQMQEKIDAGVFRNMFLLFDNNLNGMLSFEDFSAVLESLGDENSTEIRKQRFDQTDTDLDGWISYDEYLSLVYNFDAPVDGNLVGLAKLCFDVAENIRFVSSLSVGEQLEYGLF